VSKPLSEEQCAAFEAKCLAEGNCPGGGGRLRLEQWDSHGPTMACGMCDCFGFDPADPRLSNR
jgi:hypothetical protein